MKLPYAEHGSSFFRIAQAEMSTDGRRSFSFVKRRIDTQKIECQKNPALAGFVLIKHSSIKYDAASDDQKSDETYPVPIISAAIADTFS